MLQMRNIRKVYPDGTEALNNVDFVVKTGEVHGLIGENGAGKTTLMRILSGLIKPTEGQILLEGAEVKFQSTRDAIEKGIGIVQQHFALVENFTVMENLVLGFEQKTGVIVNQTEVCAEIQRLSERTGLKVDPDSLIQGLPVGVQQRVEILKTLYRGAKILILDEPTSVLSPIEVKEFFRTLKNLKEQGTTIILVTHKMPEVLEACDKITVLRKGRVVGIVDAKESSPEELARMMVGREVILRIKKKEIKPGKPMIECHELSVKDDRGFLTINNLSFEVRSGEILAVAGIEGNGQKELVEALTGLRKIQGGKILVDSKDVTEELKNLRNLGVAHIPEDKQGRGLVLDFSVSQNLILGSQESPEFSTRFGMNFKAIHDFARNAIERFGIQTSGDKANVRFLSGGNQQRVVIARELSRNPGIIIAAQPTRGLDVASTEYVWSLLLKKREEGKGVLIVTSDLDEAMQLSDRLAVMYRGQFIGLGRPEELTLEQIGLWMGGVRS